MQKFNTEKDDNLPTNAFSGNPKKVLKKLLFIIIVLVLVLIVMIAVPLFNLLP